MYIYIYIYVYMYLYVCNYIYNEYKSKIVIYSARGAKPASGRAASSRAPSSYTFILNIL